MLKNAFLFRLIAFLLGLSSVVLTVRHIQRPPFGAMIKSRLATVDALVHGGTFAIDKSVFGNTIDKVRLNGHFYSMKPPMPSVIGAGVYWIYNRVTGRSFENYLGRTCWFMGFVMGVVPYIIFLLYFFWLLQLWFKDPYVIIWVFSAVCFGYLGTGYATNLNNHNLSATVLVMAFTHAYRLRKGMGSPVWEWILCGFLAGLLPTFDHPSLFFSLALFVYLLVYDSRNIWRFFVGAALVPIIIHFWINIAFSGAWLPLEVRHDLRVYPGSFWLTPSRNDALHEPKLIYLFHLLLGHHGLFSMTPLFVLSLGGLWRHIRKHDFKYAESMLVGITLMASLVFYVFATSNYGGMCVGLRWMIPLMPLLFLFSGDWLVWRSARLKWVLFIGLFLIGFFNSMDALRNPYVDSRWDQWIHSLR